MRTVALVGVLASVFASVRSGGAAPELGPESYYVEDDSRSPAISSNGSVHVLVWTHVREDDGALADVRAQRVAADGEPIGEAITVAGTAHDEWRPAVASDGSSFLVVWEDAGSDGGSERNTIVASRLGADGSVGAPMVLGTGSNPALAGRSGAYLVTWIAGAEEFDYPEVYGRRVSSAGVLLDANRIQLGVSNGVWDNDVCSNGTNFLVTWVTESEVEGRIVEVDGSLDEARALFEESSNPFSLGGATSASDGADYLVAFRGHCEGCEWGADWYGVAGVLADGDTGEPLESFRIATDGSEPDVTFLADAYLVAWEDPRAATPDEPDNDTWVARVGTTGDLLDGGPDEAGLQLIEWGLNPRLSAIGDDAFVIATRGDDVTGRTASFAVAPGPSDPPHDPPDDPPDEPPEEPPDDPGPGDDPDGFDAPLPRAPGERDDPAGGGCAVGGQRAPVSVALLLAPWLWFLRRRATR